jgi:hypothetical protein
MILREKERIKKEIELTHSPTRKKIDSPPKLPNPLSLSADKDTFLNLLNLQPTKRDNKHP